MPTLTFETPIPVSADALFAWHERPGAFMRLSPPWMDVTLEAAEGIRDGDRAYIRLRQGPASILWVAEHFGYVPGRQFRDVQVRGPFRRWEHTHRMEPHGPSESRLIDHIDYALPLGAVGAFFGGRLAQAQLRRQFAYRHRITRQDLVLHQQYNPTGRALRIAVSGASGLIGRSLVAFLQTGGHRVYPMVRSRAQAAETPDAIYWHGPRGEIDAGRLEGLDAVIHLAGESALAYRWSDAKKQRLYDSRIEGTRLISETLAALDRPPPVFLSASAIGYYGHRSAERIDEAAAPGDSFLARLCQDWEAATRVAADAGIRTALLRIGVVLSPQDGALAMMLPAFKAGLGGVIGRRDQYLSWIALDDVLGSLYHLLFTDGIAGPVNLVAPAAATTEAFAEALGAVLHRPTWLHVPPPVLRGAMGEAAEETVLMSSHVAPGRLLETGYRFQYPHLASALPHMLGRIDPTPDDSRP